MHRKRENKLSTERFDQITEENILDVCSHQIVDSTLKLREIYNDTVENFFQGDRKALKELAEAAERLALTSSEHHKYDILPILYKMQSRSLDMGYHFVQALEHLNEATQSLAQFSESIFTYVDNNHTRWWRRSNCSSLWPKPPSDRSREPSAIRRERVLPCCI